MRKVFLLIFLIMSMFATQASAAILIFSPNGTYTTKPDLATAAASADTLGKRIVVTSPVVLTTAVVINGGRTLDVQDAGAITYSGLGALTFATASVIRAEIFGAVAGGTSNAAAVNAAVNAAAPYSTIVIPAGRFEKAVTIGYGQDHLTFTSHDAQIGYNSSAFIPGTYAGYTGSVFLFDVFANHIQFNRIKMDCNYTNSNVTGGLKITMHFEPGSQYGDVTNCTFFNELYPPLAQGVSLNFRSGTYHMHAENNWFVCDTTTTGVGGGGIDSSGAYNLMIGNHFVDLLDANLSLDNSVSNSAIGNFFVNDRIVGGVLAPVGTMLQVAHGSVGFVVSGNNFNGVSLRAIYVYTAILGLATHDGIVAGNTIDGGGYDVTHTGFYSAIDCYDGVYNTTVNVLITGNSISNLPNYSGASGIGILTTGIDVKDNLINLGSGDSNIAGVIVYPAGSGANNNRSSIEHNRIYGGASAVYVNTGAYNNVILDIERNIMTDDVTAINVQGGFAGAGASLDIRDIDNKFFNVSNYYSINRGYVWFQANGLPNKPYQLASKSNISMWSTYTAPPPGGNSDTWIAGDKIYYFPPAAGGYEGIVCTTGGVGGAATWKTFGAITP